MAWGKAGSTTLSSTSDTITVSGMTANTFNQILNHAIPNNDSTQTRYSVNGVDTGSKYSYRNTKLGQYHSTGVDQTMFFMIWVEKILINSQLHTLLMQQEKKN